MKDNDARTTIESLLSKMRDILLVANVPGHQINMRSCAFKIDTCTRAFDWLHDLYLSLEYEGIVKVYRLLPPEIWTRYKTLGIDGLAEQILLEKAAKKLLKRWRKQRPNMFGRNRKSDLKFVIQPAADYCREK